MAYRSPPHGWGSPLSPPTPRRPLLPPRPPRGHYQLQQQPSRATRQRPASWVSRLTRMGLALWLRASRSECGAVTTARSLHSNTLLRTSAMPPPAPAGMTLPLGPAVPALLVGTMPASLHPPPKAPRPPLSHLPPRPPPPPPPRPRQRPALPPLLSRRPLAHLSPSPVWRSPLPLRGQCMPSRLTALPPWIFPASPPGWSPVAASPSL